MSFRRRKWFSPSSVRHLWGGVRNLSLPSSHGLPPRVLLAAQPKSGTYLYAEILQNIGLDFTHIHLAPRKIQAYDKNMPRLSAENPRAFDCRIPLLESRRLIRTGQVGASHLTPEDADGLFDEFKVIAVNRELRSSFVSFVNFINETGRGSGKIRARIHSEGLCGFMSEKGSSYIDHALGIRSWSSFPNALVLRCEDLHEDPGAQVGEIASFLGFDGVDGEAAYRTALGRQTLTKSKGKSKVAWGAEEEEVFVRIGGVDANRQMGYPE